MAMQTVSERQEGNWSLPNLRVKGQVPGQLQRRRILLEATEGAVRCATGLDANSKPGKQYQPKE
jgi:hypothetical protein